MAHITRDGLVDTKDHAVPVRDIAEWAKQHSTPLLVVGCNSADFVSAGYTSILNSVDVVDRLASSLRSGQSYGEFVSGLASQDEAVQLDWAFLIQAGELLRIRIIDINGKEIGLIYAAGFPGMQDAAPPPSGLASLAVQSGVPFWIWRGLVFSFAMLTCVFAATLFRPGLGEELLTLCTRCLGALSVLALGLVALMICVLVTPWTGFIGVVIFAFLAAMVRAVFSEIQISKIRSRSSKDLWRDILHSAGARCLEGYGVRALMKPSHAQMQDLRIDEIVGLLHKVSPSTLEDLRKEYPDNTTLFKLGQTMGGGIPSLVLLTRQTVRWRRSWRGVNPLLIFAPGGWRPPGDLSWGAQ